MIDAIANWIAPKVKAFFNWWANTTGLKIVKYGNISVNWPVVVFFVLIIVVMFVFLPGGLLDMVLT